MTPQQPRVVATDLDGTIVRSDGTISDRTRAALAAVEAAGTVVVIVTGRPPRWLRDIPEQTGHRGMAICANGALVVDLARGVVVEQHPLAAEVLRPLVETLRSAVPGLTFAVESVTDGFSHEPSYHPRWTTDGVRVAADLDELLGLPAAKLLARHDSIGPDELLRRAREVVGDEVATLTHSSTDGLLEISAAGVTKASTLERLCAELGVGADEVVAFGDMPNDLPMLAWAGRGIAVANAHPDVLAAVDEVTASNDDDGVAAVLEQLV